MRWLSLVALCLTACLAPKVSADGGPFADSGLNAACVSAGGICSLPTDCAEQIGDIGCGPSGKICCAPVETVGAPTTDATTTPGVADASTRDASPSGTTNVAAGCSTACESLCEGDPICIQNCGC